MQRCVIYLSPCRRSKFKKSPRSALYDDDRSSTLPHYTPVVYKTAARATRENEREERHLRHTHHARASIIDTRGREARIIYLYTHTHALRGYRYIRELASRILNKECARGAAAPAYIQRARRGWANCARPRDMRKSELQPLRDDGGEEVEREARVGRKRDGRHETKAHGSHIYIYICKGNGRELKFQVREFGTGILSPRCVMYSWVRGLTEV